MRLIIKGSSRCGTTITRRILSKHSDIHITNELRMYCETITQRFGSYPALSADTPEEYFRSLLKKMRGGEGIGYHKLPVGFNKDTFVSQCLKAIKEDTMINRVEAVEQVLFSDKFKYCGDKGGDLTILTRLPNTKIIFIHRDGRDVAVSGARFKRGLKPPWSNNPIANAHYWAENMSYIFDQLNQFEDYIVIRFEDYIDFPAKNFEKFTSFLGLGMMSYTKYINRKKAHKGYYSKHWPNWKKTATPLTKEMLKELNYI